VEKILNDLFQVLQKLFGQHRQLLEIVRTERENLIQLDKDALVAILSRKQSTIEAIGQAENQRLQLVSELGRLWGRPSSELTLTQIVIEIQGFNPKLAEQYRSTYHALTILIQRISEQNRDNQKFLNRSIDNIAEMKRNVLGVAATARGTYSHQGQRVTGASSSHLISREA
jgi:tRNA A37 N6-isopentenylltransferase MiaA